MKGLISALLPTALKRKIKLKKLNKKYGGGNRIQSTNINSNAKLTSTTEIADGVWIGEFATIGRHSYVQRGTEILSAQIGDFCSIGTNCHIGMYEHPTDNISTSSRLYLKMLAAKDYYNDIPTPAIIGSDVWVGSNSTILGGVQIGDGAIIGAGAVVTKDVPPYAIVGGVPAKIIRYRFSQEKIAELLQLQWWTWEDEKILKEKEFFLNK